MEANNDTYSTEQKVYSWEVKNPFLWCQFTNCILPVASEETEAPDFDVSMYKITYATETSHFHSQKKCSDGVC